MRAEKGAHLEIVCGLIPHLGFKSQTLRQSLFRYVPEKRFFDV